MTDGEQTGARADARADAQASGAGGAAGGYEWGEEPDLTSISEEELKARLEGLAEEEKEISYRRRVIQGRIDLIRAELVRRGGATLTPEELARVLLGNTAPGESEPLGEEEGPGGRAS